jgi:hypothetical protein
MVLHKITCIFLMMITSGPTQAAVNSPASLSQFVLLTFSTIVSVLVSFIWSEPPASQLRLCQSLGTCQALDLKSALFHSSFSSLIPFVSKSQVPYMKGAFNRFLPPLQMKLTRLLQLARLSSGQLPRFPAAPLCACQGLNPAASTSESPHAPVEGPRLYSATAPLYMRAGGRVDASAVAAVLEEADGVSDIRSEDLVVNRTTSPKVRKSCSCSWLGHLSGCPVKQQTDIDEVSKPSMFLQTF